MKIFVVKNEQLIGTLSESNSHITFTYHDDIEKTDYINSLDDKINISETLFPIFENMLPEFEQLNLLKATYNITAKIEVLLYLDDIHGSYEFYRENDFFQNTKLNQNIYKYDDIKREILDSEYIFPNILDYSLNIEDSILYPNGLANSKVIGLSGYQYKFSVLKDDKTQTISYDLSKKSTYFIKPYSKYYSTFAPQDKTRSYIPYLLINEHIFMSFARDFGFCIPYNAIIKHGSDYHYIIKRFDRYNESKIDHHEILTLMNKHSEQKYKVSMREVFETVQKYISKEELTELYKFIVFSVVIGHGDLHAKNLSLIYASNKLGEKNMHLSPFYDISTTKIYKDTKLNDIGLKIGNKTSKIKKDDLIQLATVIGINKGDAKEIINLTAQKFIDTFQNYINMLPQNIKALPFHKNKYGGQVPLEVVLKDYYKNRIEYLYKFIITEHVTKDIWS